MSSVESRLSTLEADRSLLLSKISDLKSDVKTLADCVQHDIKADFLRVQQNIDTIYSRLIRLEDDVFKDNKATSRNAFEDMAGIPETNPQAKQAAIIFEACKLDYQTGDQVPKEFHVIASKESLMVGASNKQGHILLTTIKCPPGKFSFNEIVDGIGFYLSGEGNWTCDSGLVPGTMARLELIDRNQRTEEKN